MDENEQSIRDWLATRGKPGPPWSGRHTLLAAGWQDHPRAPGYYVDPISGKTFFGHKALSIHQDRVANPK
jgi:hypothetical protein